MAERVVVYSKIKHSKNASIGILTKGDKTAIIFEMILIAYFL
jgi:hypothetical protein